MKLEDFNVYDVEVDEEMSYVYRIEAPNPEEAKSTTELFEENGELDEHEITKRTQRLNFIIGTVSNSQLNLAKKK